MADIFLAYSHRDRDRVASLIQALSKQGFTTWSDLEIMAGDRWGDVIRNALNESKVVICLWTPASIKSEWVRAEAQIAADLGKLIPVIFGEVQIPPGFLHIQHLDLKGWDGTPDSPEFIQLQQAIQLVSEDTAGVTVAAEGDPSATTRSSQPLRAYKKLGRAKRTKIFLAHASADKPKMKPVVMTLIDQGFKLWIDRPQAIGLPIEYEEKLFNNRIHFGPDWREAIRVAVKQSNIVLAFWSRDAVDGRREQFHYEVYLGMMQHKLNQCRIDRVEMDQIGMPYTFDHIADLAELVGEAYHPELEYLMEDMVSRDKRLW